MVTRRTTWFGLSVLTTHLSHDRLLHNAGRWKREFSSSAGCSRCGDAWEDSLHVFKDFPTAREVWVELNPHTLVYNFFSLPLKERFEENLKVASIGGEEIDWLEKMGLT